MTQTHEHREEPIAWHALGREEVEARLGTQPNGLTPSEARTRLERYGPNELEEEPPPSALALLIHQFQSPLIYILLAAALITLALRDYIDAAVIAAVLALNTIIGFTQERRAEQAVRALMQLVVPRARVLRDGQEREVESRELVPGDVVLLESGSRVPADLRLFATTSLTIDESLLTGESVPAHKHTGVLAPDAGLADRENMAYAGTTVLTGRSRGYVVATGGATELGSIAARVRGAERAQTPLQQRMTRFAHVVAAVVGAAAVLAVVIGVLMGESPVDMFMVAVALAVAAVPEGLPVVFTVTLALGVRRMAQRNAIIRRLPAVETLGSVTTIGSDKTGTLTQNRMTVQQIWAGGKTYPVTGEESRESREALQADLSGGSTPQQALGLTLLAGILANESELRRIDGGLETTGDPTEGALLVAGAALGLDPQEARAAWKPVAEIPFESDRRYSASIREHEGEYLEFVKGAPERLLQMCTAMLVDGQATELDSGQVQAAAGKLATQGLRVLAMAYRRLPGPPADVEELPEPDGLTLLGLQGMMDPPREGVREAIAGCQDAGIRVLMITGDHAATARSIAAMLGIDGGDRSVLTGADLEQMDDEELRDRVEEVSVYARVAPEHKLRVVRALQDRGEVVAVTGDGVNDAPALKAAAIGIAMGQSGTDVAREASDMVLADDNFVSIYAAVEEGRVTFDNLRKVTFFLISTGAAAILTILATLVLRWPLPFLPAQLLWLNLVTNGLQDLALAFEPGERDIIRRPPRPPEEGIISPLLWERTALAGLVMAIGTLALFRWELGLTGDLGRAQTVALTTMVLFQNFHVWNARSELVSAFRKNPFSNPFLFVAVAAALLVHIGALYCGPAQFILRVEPIETGAWARIVTTAVTILVAVEIHKLVRRGVRRGPRPVHADGRPDARAVPPS